MIRRILPIPPGQKTLPAQTAAPTSRQNRTTTAVSAIPRWGTARVIPMQETPAADIITGNTMSHKLRIPIIFIRENGCRFRLFLFFPSMNFLSPDDRDRYLCICGSKYSRTLFSDHHQMHIPSRPSAPFQNSPVRVPDRSLHNDRINHRSITFFHPVLTPVHTEQRPARPYCQIPE